MTKKDWISVQDRKPKSGKLVLVKSSVALITSRTKVGIGVWWNKKDSGGHEGWELKMQYDEGDCDTITHWQPLPR